jgi:hypothetical protein
LFEELEVHSTLLIIITIVVEAILLGEKLKVTV